MRSALRARRDALRNGFGWHYQHVLVRDLSRLLRSHNHIAIIGQQNGLVHRQGSQDFHEILRAGIHALTARHNGCGSQALKDAGQAVTWDNR